MKKVLITTLHSQNNNFGSVLQGYALYHFIKKNNYEVEVLNYVPYYANGSTNLVNAIKKVVVNTIFLPYFVKRSIRFSKFIEQEKLTKKYKTSNEIYENPPKADIYIVGSDQVWNFNYKCGNDDIYYLKYTLSKSKMSYASSVGRVINNDKEIEKLINLTNDFKYLSLRENKSVDQLRRNGRKEIEYTIDPVFLLELSEYKDMQILPKEKGYILAYIIHKDPFISSVIEKVAKITNKKVIQVGGFSKKCNYDSFPKSAGPNEFLGYIDNADIVITSSFHGTAFSHIYKKQFIVVMPESNTLRIENILETAGTQNRVVNKNNIENLSSILNKPIDYREVTKKLDYRVSKSKNFLINSLENLSKEGTEINE